MKPFFSSLLGVILLVGGLSTDPCAVRQAMPEHANEQKKPAATDHPKIRQAIAALEAARQELQQSPGDFGGHKAEAIDAVNNAEKRLRLALQFEKF